MDQTIKIIQVLKEIWWLLGVAVYIIVHLVSVHMKVNANDRAVSKLFKLMEEIQGFKIRQETTNDIRETRLTKMEERMLEATRNVAEQFGNLGARIDKIYEAMRSKD